MALKEKFKEWFSLKKIQRSISPKKTKKEPEKKGKELQFKVGATSGIYYAARAEEMAGIIAKMSYTLTRGASVLELAADVPHEVDYTQGKEMRHISKSQGLDITLHGALSVPMCMPEMTEWNNAQQHIQMSIMSGVLCGAKYTNFHSCLKEWLELFTYASSKLEIVMCDHKGRFIKDLFKEELGNGNHNQATEKLREWFVNEKEEGGSAKNFVEELGSLIVGHDTSNSLFHRARDEVYNKFYGDKLKGEIKEMVERDIDKVNDKRHEMGKPPLTKEELEKEISKDEETMSSLRIRVRNRDLRGDEAQKLSERTSKRFKELMKDGVSDYLKDGKPWFRVERAGTLEHAYRIVAHYLFFSKDKIWQNMISMYKDKFEEDPDLKYNENDDQWLERALLRLETLPDKQLIHDFKEFYYGVIGAKFLESHIKATVRWMEKEAPKTIDNIVERTEPDKTKIEEQKKILRKNLEDMIIAIENPDARGEHAGRFILWRPKQFLLAIKNARESLKKEGSKYGDKIFIIVDFEHLATQGVDPLKELEELKDHDLSKDLGEYSIGVHVGVPTPLHVHKPIKAADREIVYRLLWKLKEVGLGSKHLTYLIFERGGFKQPYGPSVRVLKLFARLMKEGISPENLPDAFFVVSKPQYIARQKAIIFDHTFDPIKGLLKFPEEEYTLLGTAVLKAGKKPEEWKKEELR